LILFHSSIVEIENIDLNICKPYKDFGRGFYTTVFEDQAVNMAKRTVIQFGGKPYITKYLIDKNDLENTCINLKVFNKPS